MERKIGETFEYRGRKLMVVEKSGYECKNCFFYNKPCSLMLDVIGLCCGRTDKKYVTFIKQPQELNLCEILKDCPIGFELYSSVYGKVKFAGIDKKHTYPWIDVITENSIYISFTSEGKLSIKHNGECVLFPSKDQRDWSKFTASWYNNDKKNKKEKFDPKTFQSFDRVLGCLVDSYWKCDIFSNIIETAYFPYKCSGDSYIRCIPYNDETKHLVGTTDAAPDFYRYWE